MVDDQARPPLRKKVQRLSDRLHLKRALFRMWRDQVGEFDKLVLECHRHVVIVLIVFLARCIVDLNPFLARAAWSTSSTLDDHRLLFRRDRRHSVVHGDGRDRASLGVRDVEQIANRFVLLLELRSHVLGCRNTTTRVQEHLKRRFLSNRRQGHQVVCIALAELSSNEWSGGGGLSAWAG